MEERVGRSLVSAARWSGVVGDVGDGGGGNACIVNELAGEVSEWLLGGERVEIDTLGFEGLEVFGGRWFGGVRWGVRVFWFALLGGSGLCEC